MGVQGGRRLSLRHSSGSLFFAMPGIDLHGAQRGAREYGHEGGMGDAGSVGLREVGGMGLHVHWQEDVIAQ